MKSFLENDQPFEMFVMSYNLPYDDIINSFLDKYLKWASLEFIVERSQLNNEVFICSIKNKTFNTVFQFKDVESLEEKLKSEVLQKLDLSWEMMFSESYKGCNLLKDKGPFPNKRKGDDTKYSVVSFLPKSDFKVITDIDYVLGLGKIFIETKFENKRFEVDGEQLEDILSFENERGLLNCLYGKKEYEEIAREFISEFDLDSEIRCEKTLPCWRADHFNNKGKYVSSFNFYDDKSLQKQLLEFLVIKRKNEDILSTEFTEPGEYWYSKMKINENTDKYFLVYNTTNKKVQIFVNYKIQTAFESNNEFIYSSKDVYEIEKLGKVFRKGYNTAVSEMTKI